MMVEGGALEVTREDVVEALTVAQSGIRELDRLSGGAVQGRRPLPRRWRGKRPPSPKGWRTA
jgi:hypothetical protein